jgi:tRNA(Ile)-lysidine synthase
MGDPGETPGIALPGQREIAIPQSRIINTSASDVRALALWDGKTSAFLSAQGWAPKGTTVLLAVSGGADSVALLHWALRAAPGMGWGLAVAHVNHGLRATAGRDQEFVSALCREYRIPCFGRNLDPAGRPSRESLEMWARRERYGFFAEAADRSCAEWILTAHHRDDLVETVFQRLGRGTGPRGLRGIPFRRGRVVRPFLDRSRAEILAYLRLCGASWREDESNADVRIDRNWYRHRYLPALRAKEPGLDERVFRMAMSVQSLGKQIDALEEEAGLLRTDGSGRPFLELKGIDERVAEEDLESLDFWMRRLLCAEPFSRSAVVTKEILREFCRQWKTGPGTLRVPLNARLALKGGNNGIYCTETPFGAQKRDRKGKKSCSPEAQRVILDAGSGKASWRWGDRTYSLVARRYPRPKSLDFPASREERAIFDADLFSCTLLVRTRKDGDRFSPLGLQSRSRKLKTFFNEEKVPAGMRDIIPIVLTGAEPGSETPAWVPGYGISDFFKVSGSTSHILELVIKCENP